MIELNFLNEEYAEEFSIVDYIYVYTYLHSILN